MVGHSAITRYIADGFRQDADKILHRFVEVQSYDFPDFAAIWRDMKFSLVYMGRPSQEELREFTEECFLITLSYLSPKSSLRIKVGALYLLYGLYQKQPFDTKYKIRIQLPQWNELASIFDFGIKENHLTICFIIDKLLCLDAFHFVSLPRLMSPLVTVTSEPTYQSDGRVENLKSCLKEFIEGGSLKNLGELHEIYEREKEKLKITKDSACAYSLPENKYLEISKEFQELVTTEVDHKPSSVAKDDGASKDDLGSRRSSLKQKQYQQTATGDFVKRRNELLRNLSSCEDNDNSLDEDYVPPPGAVSGPGASAKKKVQKRRRRRKPKWMRKPGRPKKITSETEDSDKLQTSAKEGESEFEGFSSVDYITYMRQQKPEGRQRRPKPRKTRYHFAHESDDEAQPPVLCEESDAVADEDDKKD